MEQRNKTTFLQVQDILSNRSPYLEKLLLVALSLLLLSDKQPRIHTVR